MPGKIIDKIFATAGGFGKALIRLNIPRLTPQFNSFMKWICIRDTLKRLRVNCVLDVGANEGQYAKNLRQIGYQGQIISFEPIGEVYRRLSEKFSSDSRWQGLNIALGATDSFQEFNVATESSVMSSFLNLKHQWDFRIETVEVRRLDSLFREIVGNIQGPRVFLKLDTQGYDLEVVQGAVGCMEDIVGMQSELSVQQLYEGAPHYLESVAKYEQLGFELIGLYEICRINDRVAEYDCIMEHTSRYP
jgi:FkbM family methyltransferase